MLFYTTTLTISNALGGIVTEPGLEDIFVVLQCNNFTWCGYVLRKDGNN